MNDAITKLAKALDCSPDELEVALDGAALALVWDPEEAMPEKLMAVHRTGVVNTGKDGNKHKSYWWTLKPTDRGKHTNRSTGEVFKWKT